jgi:hypothetical protein
MQHPVAGFMADAESMRTEVLLEVLHSLLVELNGWMSQIVRRHACQDDFPIVLVDLNGDNSEPKRLLDDHLHGHGKADAFARTALMLAQ